MTELYCKNSKKISHSITGAAYFFMLDIIAITTNPKVKVIINASNTVIGFHLLTLRSSSANNHRPQLTI